ncbi:MAG: hypothetical protein ASARMPREDX12_003354 [Alectoria sarmentosa]|nr:MAG: hypothetical protein ASARMPREDX12_003354 [Alectoria sarmentosa]
MGETQFLVGGTSLSSIVREADGLDQSFVGVIECPQGAFPELAGRRLFLVKYGNIDLEDVETKGGIASSRSGRHVNDLPPRYRDSYADEYDNGNRDRDYNQSPPSRSRRRNSYANDYDPGDTYDNDPEPPPSRSTGTIRSLFNILTPREARSQGVVILDTGTGRLPRFPNTATTHTHATVIDGTGPGTLLSYL